MSEDFENWHLDEPKVLENGTLVLRLLDEDNQFVGSLYSRDIKSVTKVWSVFTTAAQIISESETIDDIPDVFEIRKG